MNIFMRKETFLIKRIEKVISGWNLYPVEKNNQPVFISKDNYSGKMPPFFKWPRQKVKLEITRIQDNMLSAVLNGIKLFEIAEADYPPEVKKILQKGEKLEQEADAAIKAQDNAIKAALSEYLLTVPLNPGLEDEISKFHICLRAYLKLHLFKGASTKDYLRRLNLMALIFEIARRIYCRHVDERDFLGITMGELRFGMHLFGEVYPSYRIDVKEIENAVKDKSKTDVSLADYYEAEKLIAQMLPETANTLLLRYLNYVVRDVLSVFSGDYSEFDCKLLKDGWTGRRICTNEQDYKYQYKNMKMLKYSSFILPDVIPDKAIDSFIQNYNLK